MSSILEGSDAGSAKLQRVLSARDLILYGIVIITPIAPVPIFGIGQQLSHGHLILCLLLAGVAMMLTAFSYGRMASLYPSAGSAYTYVGRGLHRHLGFVAGWAMILDYLVLPIVAVVQASLAANRLVPAIPYVAWVTMIVLVVTLLNLRGVKSAARVNTLLLLAMFGVIAAFLACAVGYLLERDGVVGLFSIAPFYHRDTFNIEAVALATSFAALTFIGFDGITTLSEDVKNPTRSVPLAIVSVCAFTTLFSCVLVYLAQLAWPNYADFSNVETAFMDVSRRVGGAWLFQALGLVVMLSSFGAAIAAQIAASRVPFAMGRDGALPSSLFTYLSPRGHNPTVNIVLVGAVAWVGSVLLSLEHAGVLLNFGAFLSFMGVNLAAIRQEYIQQAQSGRRVLWRLLMPSLGFLFCLVIWISLPVPAKVMGGAWLLLGITFYVVSRFRSNRERETIQRDNPTSTNQIG